MGLVDELRSEHAALARTFQQVNDLGIGSLEGQRLLQSARAALLDHLKKEDRQLYPVLSREALGDAQLKGLLESLGKEMVDLAVAAESFFLTYKSGGSGLQFAKDYGRLFAALATRMRREETQLYPLFDKYAPGR